MRNQYKDHYGKEIMSKKIKYKTDYEVQQVGHRYIIKEIIDDTDNFNIDTTEINRLEAEKKEFELKWEKERTERRNIKIGLYILLLVFVTAGGVWLNGTLYYVWLTLCCVLGFLSRWIVDDLTDKIIKKS